MTAALEGGEWSAARPGLHFTPGKNPVPILQEAGWAPGPVWTGGRSRPHRYSIPDRPARSQSLYRLSYPAHRNDGNKSNYTGDVILLCVIERTYTDKHTHSNTNSECQAAEGALWQLWAFR